MDSLIVANDRFVKISFRNLLRYGAPNSPNTGPFITVFHT